MLAQPLTASTNATAQKLPRTARSALLAGRTAGVGRIDVPARLGWVSLGRLVERLHLHAERLQRRGAVLGRGMRRGELRRRAAELAHLFPKRHCGFRIVARPRRELDAD